MAKRKTDTANHMDILCSIWILACNDENPQISYQGITQRLGLPEDFDVQSLIQKRGELFRKKTTPNQLNRWKEEMLIGKNLPNWIREIEDQQKRILKINSLKVEDVFRSQFRPEQDSPRSDIQIIDWGLQHIDRLRRVEMETNNEKIRKFTSIYLPTMSTIVAVIAVISSFYVQYTNNKNQAILKHYEVELRPKQEGYSIFMQSFFESLRCAGQNDKVQMYHELDKIIDAYFIVEPFLPDKAREMIWNKYQRFSLFCTSLLEADSIKKRSDESIKSIIEYEAFFRSNLYETLFSLEERASIQEQ
jgi:hypothetical protein